MSNLSVALESIGAELAALQSEADQLGGSSHARVLQLDVANMNAALARLAVDFTRISTAIKASRSEFSSPLVLATEGA
jgi:outer membrane murein-binding lipoprotein Lpp